MTQEQPTKALPAVADNAVGADAAVNGVEVTVAEATPPPAALIADTRKA